MQSLAGLPEGRADGLAVEREGELTTFARATRRAAGGRGGVLAVTGPAGVGKTCLLEQVAADAAAAGWSVRTVRAPRVRARRSTAGEVLAVLLEGTSTGGDARARPEDGPARALGSFDATSPATSPGNPALRWLLEDLTAERPALLVVDDLDWADPATIRQLAGVADDVRSLPCVLAVSVSDDEPGSPAPAESRRLALDLVAVARRVPLGPLSRQATAELASRLRPGLGSAEVDVLHARSRGNPRSLVDLLRTGPEAARPVPTSLLTTDETDVLRLVCLLDDLPDVDEVAAAAADADGRATLTRLADAGLVILDPPYVTPSGPRVRAAVLREMPRAIAAELHDRLARVLLARGASAGRVVPHLLEGHPRIDPGARGALSAAGRAALDDGDDRLANALLQRALDEGPAGAEDAALHADLARAQAGLGDLDAALASWTRAQRLTPDRVARNAYAVAAADAMAEAGRVPDRSPRLAAAVALAARCAGADTVGALGLSVAEEAATGRRRPRSLLPATMLLIGASAFDAADDVLTRTLALAALDPHDAAAVAACRGLVRVRAGRIADGLVDLEVSRQGPEVLAAPHAAARDSVVVEARLARGELAEAAGLADTLARSPVVPGPGSGLAAGLVRHALAEVASASGDDRRAVELYREAGAAAVIDNPAFLPWRVGAAFAELRCGDGARALDLARLNLDLARAFGSAYAEAQALRTLAVVDVTAHRTALLREALDHASTAASPRLRAVVEADLGALLALQPAHRDTAVELLRSADAYAGGEGLPALQQRARRVLDLLGAGPAPQRAEQLATLTTGERRTARLAADGHTNRVIAHRLGVSVKAVEWHLSSCYRKLGIRSRRQLPAMLG